MLRAHLLELVVKGDVLFLFQFGDLDLGQFVLGLNVLHIVIARFDFEEQVLLLQFELLPQFFNF